MKRWTKQMTRIAGVITAGALVAACGAGGRPSSGSSSGGAAQVGITKDTVTVGATFPLTGVAAPGYSEIPSGAQAYLSLIHISEPTRPY